jgi:hypothetical protein
VVSKNNATALSVGCRRPVNLRGGAPFTHFFRIPRHSLLLRHVSDCPLKSYSQFLLSLFGKTPRVARRPS